MLINLGTDPEFVIIGPEGQPVPAHRFFPSRDDKIEIDIHGRGKGKLFRDGYALEINVPPDYCRARLSNSMAFMLVEARKRLKPGYRLSSVPAWKVDLAELRKAPEDVRIFGCDPSLDAYTGDEKVSTLDGETHPYRYAGGHMHFSVRKAKPYTYDYELLNTKWMQNFEEVRRFIRLLDVFVGLPLTYIFGAPSTFRRRQFYGQAGEFRQQKYPDGARGIEYRVPGPQLWNNRAVASFAFGVGREVFRVMCEDRHATLPSLPVKVKDYLVQRAINTGEGAETLLVPWQNWYTLPQLAAARASSGLHAFRLGTPLPKGEINHMGWGDWTLAHRKEV